LVPASNAIVGIDLADAKQMVVVTDHDSKVLARKTFRCRAWDLGAALDWADVVAAVRTQIGSGRTLGRSDSAIQPGQPNPDSRLFGQVTSRTRRPAPSGCW
jgi:hypothetical protein